MISYTSAFAVLLVVVLVVAEPPARENARFSKQFQGSFQPVLLRPLGGQFVILEQLQSAPQPANNPPLVQNNTPQLQNNPPEVNVQENERNSTARSDTSSADSDAEELAPSGRSEKLTKSDDEGVYYIYHPSGLLQRVMYATKDDAEKMAFSARLKYENVEPIRDPIYTYDPETYVFKRV